MRVEQCWSHVRVQEIISHLPDHDRDVAGHRRNLLRLSIAESGRHASADWLSIHNFEGLRMSHRLRGVTMGRLRLSFGLEHQCYPSVLTGFKVETKAIRHRLDLINLNA